MRLHKVPTVPAWLIDFLVTCLTFCGKNLSKMYSPHSCLTTQLKEMCWLSAAWVYRTPAGHVQEAEGPCCHPRTKDEGRQSDVFTELMLRLYLAATALFSSKWGTGTFGSLNVPSG